MPSQDSFVQKNGWICEKAIHCHKKPLSPQFSRHVALKSSVSQDLGLGLGDTKSPVLNGSMGTTSGITLTVIAGL
jgi:hypothetical protein